ncbi:MAG: cob(I)yrinic acid a,c-diamide adenosyltransferase [Candidatus Micrarchaeaceae archaeon]
MSRFYTGAGDGGRSNMLGKWVIKSSAIIDAIGCVDELNSFIGLAIANIDDDRIAGMLRQVQNDLFVIGAELASQINPRFAPNTAIGSVKVKWLEDFIEDLSKRVPDMKHFVLPGGSLAASYLHVARAMARRAERSAVRIKAKRGKPSSILPYLNRLSSLLFVTALYMNKKEGVEEENPHY